MLWHLISEQPQEAHGISILSITNEEMKSHVGNLSQLILLHQVLPCTKAPLPPAPYARLSALITHVHVPHGRGP